MLKYLFPKVRWGDLPWILYVAAVGAAVAGGYGVLHDQVTYSISPEYFTKLKFEQFAHANFGFSRRVFVAEIGFLATFWVGFVCAWFLGRRLIPNQPRRQALRQVWTGFGVIFASTLICELIGFGYGLWRGPDDPYQSWQSIFRQLEIDDQWAFVRVAFIHNAGYLGGVIGLVLALILVRPRRVEDLSCQTAGEQGTDAIDEG